MANVLVTGGTGLIGWCAARQLLEQGHKVVVFDYRLSEANQERIGKDCIAEQGDVTDAERVCGVMEKHAIDHVIHLAAFITDQALADPAGAFRVNVMGTSRIFDAALKFGVRRVVWTSSCVALTTTPDYDGHPVDESYNIVSRSPYGASKWGAEVVAETYHDELGLDSIAIRPALTYGIGRLHGGTGVFNSAIRDIAQGQAAGIMASPGGLHQPMYNRDMAALLIAALFGSKPSRRVYNVPVEKDYSSDEVLDILRRIVPEARVHTDPVPDFVPPIPVVDGSNARRDFDFKPEYDLERGLREMIEYYRTE